MGEKDITEKILEDHNDVFADIINGLIFAGEQRILPESLENTAVHSQYKADDEKVHELERDVAKYWKDQDVQLAICGIENQSSVEKYMPFRIIGYDGTAYRSQLQDKRKEILPVMTIVLYFGTEHRWYGKRNIKGLMKIPEGLDDYINDYKMQVFEVAWLTEEQISRFRSDFKIVANFFVQKRKNKDYIPDDPTEIKHIDEVLKLLTEPIKNLCARFNHQIPVTVVQGAKGSGKTFLYRQLIEKKNWNSFFSEITHKKISKENGYFIPVLAPQNISQIQTVLGQCIDCFNKALSFADVSQSIYSDNSYRLDLEANKEIDWMNFWEQLFVNSVNKEFTSFAQLNEKLKEEEKTVIFLIDGLEEILKAVSSNKNQQKAIEVLCQGVLNTISARYENIGLIIFIRSDMAQNAITVNYEQFRQSFAYAELKWSSAEALKLAVWLVSHANSDFYRESIPIENASQEIIDKYLEELWGLKLGKKDSNEAYSSRWILAALSDFNGQLQARDIIRFLKYAAGQNMKKPPYDDRILMPAEIRYAVPKCSNAKISDIKAEYENLKPIFEKLEDLPTDEKTLPMNLENNIFTSAEEKSMTQSGYLKRDGEKLYLPEIIRHALGFRYEKGARPRVLSLLLKH